MSNLIAFINLIRIKNLLIILLIQIVIKFYLINTYSNNSALSNIEFSIYLFSLISIIAGGYIINDLYDIEIDKINKPESRIIEKKISKNIAVYIYYILNLLGLISGFYTAYQIKKLSFGLIFCFLAFSLWQYSKNYKKSFFIGNLQVAFLTSLSIINLALFDLISIDFANKHVNKIILYIILIYAGFSFIITLIREIIKDLEDINGDREIGAKTMAITYGKKKTKKILNFLISVTILAIAYFQYFQYSILSSEFNVKLSYWGVNMSSVIYTFVLQMLLISLFIKINRAKIKSDFHNASTLCKTIMLIGILSIPFFHFLHQN